jgi:hypothetical protein
MGILSRCKLFSVIPPVPVALDHFQAHHGTGGAQIAVPAMGILIIHNGIVCVPVERRMERDYCTCTLFQKRIIPDWSASVDSCSKAPVGLDLCPVKGFFVTPVVGVTIIFLVYMIAK